MPFGVTEALHDQSLIEGGDLNNRQDLVAQKGREKGCCASTGVRLNKSIRR